MIRALVELLAQFIIGFRFITEMMEKRFTIRNKGFLFGLQVLKQLNQVVVSFPQEILRVVGVLKYSARSCKGLNQAVCSGKDTQQMMTAVVFVSCPL